MSAFAGGPKFNEDDSLKLREAAGRSRGNENGISNTDNPWLVGSAVDAHVAITKLHHISEDFRIVLQSVLSDDRKPASFGRCNHRKGSTRMTALS